MRCTAPRRLPAVLLTADSPSHAADATQMTKNPKNTLFDLRRLLGASYQDIVAEAELWPFAVSPDPQGRPRVHVEWKGAQRDFSPEQLAALVLGKMRGHAEKRFGQKVTNAVITVPAHFSDAQRRATRDAALIAGLNVLRILNAPTAAAVAFCLDSKDDSGAQAAGEQTVLVFSLSGGSCDASLVVIEQGVLEVRATAGDNRLGGEDFDNRLVEHCCREFQRATGVPIDGAQRPTSLIRRSATAQTSGLTPPSPPLLCSRRRRPRAEPRARGVRARQVPPLLLRLPAHRPRAGGRRPRPRPGDHPRGVRVPLRRPHRADPLARGRRAGGLPRGPRGGVRGGRGGRSVADPEGAAAALRAVRRAAADAARDQPGRGGRARRGGGGGDPVRRGCESSRDFCGIDALKAALRVRS